MRFRKFVGWLLRFANTYLGTLKTRLFFNNSIEGTNKISLTADVRYSRLCGNNSVGTGSVVHHSTMGEHSYVSNGCRMVNAEIGAYCSIGSGVKTSFGRHPHHYIAQHPSMYSRNSPVKSFVFEQLFLKEHLFTNGTMNVSIGNDVWIGDDVSILDGVRLGDGCVIGTRSIVTKDVPPYAIVVGVPGRVIKFRFSSTDIETLLSVKWWEWSEELILCALKSDLFRKSPSQLEDFRRKAEATNRHSD
jgi:acetyltransferase-like isoleucine patch superfamily enzyme